MSQYNYLNLSSGEFEDLARDVIQEKLGIYLESFATGKDGGIDFRRSISKSADLIVQAKRYQNVNDLIRELKSSELAKVQILKPGRYILVTSASLTPKKKRVIFDILQPYLKITEDIIGRNDLDNLLGKYKTIEAKHFKLWLTSANILSRFIHRGIHNRSQIDHEEFTALVQRYVPNPSIKAAEKIIKENNYVIISGIPGIGKTTLAKVLTARFLAQGYSEFVTIQGSIGMAFNAFQEGIRQVFLFDDFLGRNFLVSKINRDEDRDMLRFIRKINCSPDNSKILIMTTREYILKQAQIDFEGLNNGELDIAKCTIDLQNYTRAIRAEILRNHLHFSELPKEYLRALLTGRQVLDIVNHRNYSPRIIEFVCKKQNWKQVEAEKFGSYVRGVLDYPQKIWQHAFENQITALSRIILCVLKSLPNPTLLSELYKATVQFIETNNEKYRISFDGNSFNRSLKEIESTFIVINAVEIKNLPNNSQNEKVHLIDFHNPSIQDFLTEYLKENRDIIEDLISGLIYWQQGFHSFSIDRNRGFGTIKLFDEDRKRLCKILETQWSSLGFSSTVELLVRLPQRFPLFQIRMFNHSLYRVTTVMNEIHLGYDSELISLIRIDLENQEIDKLSLRDFEKLEVLFGRFQDIWQSNPNALFSHILGLSVDIDGLRILKRIGNYYPKEFQKFWSENGLEISQILDEYLEFIMATTEDTVFSIEKSIELISKIDQDFDFPVSDYRSQLENKLRYFKEPYEWENYHDRLELPSPEVESKPNISKQATYQSQQSSLGKAFDNDDDLLDLLGSLLD